jgi:prevent-host-death family protein
MTKMIRMIRMTKRKATSDKKTGAWAVAEAKARFSQVIDRALTDGPQAITRNGRTAVIVVSAEEWQPKTKHQGSLADFFATSPLRGSGLRIERVKDKPRNVDL